MTRHDTPVIGEKRRGDLQVANAPADLSIDRVASRLPKASCHLVVEGDQGSHAMDAALAQVLLAGLRQREADALPPMPIANNESVHVASPPVPSGDQGPDDLTATLGN